MAVAARPVLEQCDPFRKDASFAESEWVLQPVLVGLGRLLRVSVSDSGSGCSGADPGQYLRQHSIQK